jgi:hypothetical protein
MQPTHRSSDTCAVNVDETPTWTFARGGERLTLRREQTATGVNLVVTGSGAPRTYAFTEQDRLVAFQSDMEALLVRTGWSFVEFSPERRRGRDRRSFPRLTERRRWWTDGLPRSRRPGGESA